MYTGGFRKLRRSLVMLQVVIVRKMSGRRRRDEDMNIDKTCMLLVRVRSVSVVVCSEQQCDVPSNEIVRVKGFVWINYVLTDDEFARA